MCVDNGCILSFQLHTHSLQSTAVYSFQTGSGDELVLHSLIHGLPLQLLPSTRLSRTQTQADHTLRINIEDDTKTRQVFWDTNAISPRSRFNARSFLWTLLSFVQPLDCETGWHGQLPPPSLPDPELPFPYKGTSFISQQVLMSPLSRPPAEPPTSHSAVCERLNRCRMDEKSERIKGEIIFPMTAKTKVFFSFFFFRGTRPPSTDVR